MKCIKCGLEKNYGQAGETTGNVFCQCKLEPVLNYGWICPVCGAGLSPYTTRCPCNSKWTVTNIPTCY